MSCNLVQLNHLFLTAKGVMRFKSSRQHTHRLKHGHREFLKDSDTAEVVRSRSDDLRNVTFTKLITGLVMYPHIKSTLRW